MTPEVEQELNRIFGPIYAQHLKIVHDGLRTATAEATAAARAGGY
jgi:hypothetical protein